MNTNDKKNLTLLERLNEYGLTDIEDSPFDGQLKFDEIRRAIAIAQVVDTLSEIDESRQDNDRQFPCDMIYVMADELLRDDDTAREFDERG